MRSFSSVRFGSVPSIDRSFVPPVHTPTHPHTPIQNMAGQDNPSPAASASPAFYSSSSSSSSCSSTFSSLHSIHHFRFIRVVVAALHKKANPSRTTTKHITYPVCILSREVELKRSLIAWRKSHIEKTHSLTETHSQLRFKTRKETNQTKPRQPNQAANDRLWFM